MGEILKFHLPSSRRGAERPINKGGVAREVIGEHLRTPPVDRSSISRVEKCHQKRMSKYFLPFWKDVEELRIYYY